MSKETNIKALILRAHSEHNIRCPAVTEAKLVDGLESLWADNQLTRQNVSEVITNLPASFFAENQLDSPRQYANLIWDALSTGAKELQGPNQTSITNFNAPVQTQILQTGANSKANVIQRSQQNQSYSRVVSRALDDLRDIIDAEIIEETDREEAKIFISEAERENSKPNPDKGKIEKCVRSLGKWTGERLNKAIDTFIEMGVKYGATGSFQ